MRGFSREFLTIWAFLIGLFLILEHFTGFSKDVGAIGSNLGHLSAVLQGNAR